MTCKDCIHYDACGGFIPSDLDSDVFDYCSKGIADEIPDIDERCSNFESKADKVAAFAEDLTSFFLCFDGLILSNAEAENLLNDTKKALEEKIRHSESLLPVIFATGGDYDSGIDRAKVEQITALESLIKARRKLQKETEKEHQKKDKKIDVLKLFGL